MPLAITEDHDSRETTETRREGRLELGLERKYTITGSDDPGDNSVRALGPQPGEVYGDGTLGMYVTARKYSVLKPTGASGAIRLAVTYGPPEKLPDNNNADEPEYELSTMAETIHLEKALAQEHFPASMNSAGLAIGVNGEQIDGVDVYVPKGTYTESRYIQTLNAKFRTILFQLTGCVNDAPFKGFALGEVLFLGARARRRGYGVWKLEYQFSIQLSVAQSIDTEGGPQAFEKEGWHYLWLERGKIGAEDNSKVQHTIRAAHVAQVYPYGSFALLGIGK